MKKLMIAFAVTLGSITGFTSLQVNAATGDIRYGAWTYYTQYISKVGWETHRQCIYKRTVWKQGYGSLPDEMTSVFLINKPCPSASTIQ